MIFHHRSKNNGHLRRAIKSSPDNQTNNGNKKIKNKNWAAAAATFLKRLTDKRRVRDLDMIKKFFNRQKIDEQWKIIWKKKFSKEKKMVQLNLDLLI